MPNIEAIEAYLSRWEIVDRDAVSRFVHVKNPDDLSDYTMNFSEYTIDTDKFESYYSAHSYKTIPEYSNSPYEPSVIRKALEHFVSLEITQNLVEGGVLIDIASSHSPFGRIAAEQYEIEKCYKQDLSYEEGVHGDRIGGDAAAMPLPDESIDCLFLHNSWEHFEGSSDHAFLFEARRLLKPGGKVVIIPLDILDTPICSTSPASWSQEVGREPMKWPVFDPRFKVSIEEDIKQRQIKRHNLSTLSRDLNLIDGMSSTIVSITNPEKYKFQKNFLVLEKL